MKKFIPTIFFVFFTLIFGNSHLHSQCNATIGVNTMVVSQDTSIAVGINDNYANYLVCPGVTLTYRDNSQMDSIYLEANAALILDSANSYGYATVYAKSNSMFDANNRQYGGLYYETGSSLYDTSAISSINNYCAGAGITYNYSRLPGGVGCLASSIRKNNTDDSFSVQYNSLSNQIEITHLNHGDFIIEVITISGQKIIEQKATDKVIVNTSAFLSGIYMVKLTNGEQAFIKKIAIP